MSAMVHLYTGTGKGKTSAALGMIVRATGAGMRVLLFQFLKKGHFSEIRSLRKRFPEVTVVQCGDGCFVRGKPSALARKSAAAGLSALTRKMRSGRYDLVVADEICTAVAAGVIPASSVVAFVRKRPKHVELILTGRGAASCIAKCADLVTEMKCRRHYFDRGVKARKGIEF